MECVWQPARQTEAGDAPEIGLPFSILADWTSHTPWPSAPASLPLLFSDLEVSSEPGDEGYCEF